MPQQNRRAGSIERAVRNHARGIAAATGVPVERVINSMPVQHYREALERRKP